MWQRLSALTRTILGPVWASQDWNAPLRLVTTQSQCPVCPSEVLIHLISDSPSPPADVLDRDLSGSRLRIWPPAGRQTNKGYDAVAERLAWQVSVTENGEQRPFSCVEWSLPIAVDTGVAILRHALSLRGKPAAFPLNVWADVPCS